MKKIYGVFLVFIMISFLTTSCSDSGTNPESKRMRTYARLSNRFDSDYNQIYSSGHISVKYYPAVSQTDFLLDGLNIYEDDNYVLTGSYWEYSESGEDWDDPMYHWLANRTYELEITANNNDYVSISNCELPDTFVINENSLPDEINPWDDFVLNWSNCENETNFRLFYRIYGDDWDTLIDSLTILDSDTNTFTFTSAMLNIPGAYYISIYLTAINGPAITPDSEGNFSGDGDGYFYGEYDPGSLEINYENSRNGASNKLNRINRGKELKEKAEDLFKNYLGF